MASDGVIQRHAGCVRTLQMQSELHFIINCYYYPMCMEFKAILENYFNIDIQQKIFVHFSVG